MTGVLAEKLRCAADARGEVWRFTFPPGVVHAFQNTGVAPMLIVSFNTVAHDPARPDTTREVIL